MQNLTNKMAELEFIIKTETPNSIGINEVYIVYGIY